MKNLRKLGVAVVLTCALGLPVLAGQIETPPCAPPEPGQIETPPCSSAPGDTGTPTGASTASDDVTLATSETSFGEIAANVILTFLPLF